MGRYLNRYKVTRCLDILGFPVRRTLPPLRLTGNLLISTDPLVPPVVYPSLSLSGSQSYQFCGHRVVVQREDLRRVESPVSSSIPPRLGRVYSPVF